MIGQLAVGLFILIVDWRVSLYLGLTRYDVLHGQIWRLVTFLFQPIWLGGFLGILNLVFYFWIGNALTRVWGDFRMTLFLALGMLGAWVSCFLTGGATASAIFLSMLFAYTWLWPDQGVLLFGIIPFKMKYLGSVSYTHLDVYKRQDPRRPRHGGRAALRRPPDRAGHPAGPGRAL